MLWHATAHTPARVLEDPPFISCAERNEERTQATGHGAEATGAAFHQTNTHTHAKPSSVPCHCLLTRNHVSPSPRRSCRNMYSLMCRMVRPASNYCAVLTLSKSILRTCASFPRSLVLDYFLFCADACSSRPRRLTRFRHVQRGPMRLLVREQCFGPLISDCSLVKEGEEYICR